MQEGHHTLKGEHPAPPPPPKCREFHETAPFSTSYTSTQEDNKMETELIDKNVQSENKAKLFKALSKAWDTFHKYFFYILVAILLGIYIGITASKIYFSNKIQENISVGGMVYKEKIYTISPR